MKPKEKGGRLDLMKPKSNLTPVFQPLFSSSNLLFLG